MRCLEKKPADRFQTAEELLPQLEALTTPSGGVTPTDTRPVAGIVGGRRWRVPALVAAAAVLIVTGFGVSRLFRRGPTTITTNNIRAITSEPARAQPVAFRNDRFDTSFGQVSLDGRWIAYVSNEAGNYGVWVQAFPTGPR